MSGRTLAIPAPRARERLPHTLRLRHTRRPPPNRGMHGAGAQEHVEAVATFVASWAADITALVEVEGCRSLALLAAEVRGLPRGNATAPPDAQSDADAAVGYLLQGTDSFTEQDVALLTTCAPLRAACCVLREMLSVTCSLSSGQ